MANRPNCEVFARIVWLFVLLDLIRDFVLGGVDDAEERHDFAGAIEIRRLVAVNLIGGRQRFDWRVSLALLVTGAFLVVCLDTAPAIAFVLA